jgi:2-oxoglutarate ferredoxin oxidoreductase subunit alpha
VTDEMTATNTESSGGGSRPVDLIEREELTVRFSGDSGDGMQLAGTQMTNTSAIFGNDVSTWPDYPAEIRAPMGTIAGVSGFQLHFGSHRLRTPGDRVQVLIAMNPAALKANLAELEPGGILLANEDAFNKANLKKAGYDANPLEDGSLAGYQLFQLPIDKLNTEAVADTGLTGRAVGRCRNFVALGIVYWLFSRSMEPTLKWIEKKFGSTPAVADANARALKAGFFFGETAEMFTSRYAVRKADLEPGTYRRISGNEATALGLVAAAHRAGRTLFYGSYPITPASDILHELAKMKNFDVRTFQAEDEIAAMAAVVGAAFAGALSVTGTSGPGVALKSEAMGLAVMTELPMVVVNVQRGGPSTGLPTKTEQADLFQAILGRHGESPLPVLAPCTPGDCFHMAFEAFRIATEFMTPVMMLTDGYLANGAEPWRVPEADSLPAMKVKYRTEPPADGPYLPYERDEHLSRPWAVPGTPGLEHRIGGLEKADITGNVNYTPENHEHMVHLRQNKVDGIAKTLPPLEVFGPEQGELLVVGWGSTYGAIRTAVERCNVDGLSVAAIHLRYLHPFQRELGDILRNYKRVLVTEMNLGQLAHLLRAEFLVDAQGFNKVQGKPFLISEVEEKIRAELAPK